MVQFVYFSLNEWTIYICQNVNPLHSSISIFFSTISIYSHYLFVLF